MKIGRPSSIFSIVSVVVFADLPMAEAESVAVVRAVNPELGVDQGSLTVADYLDLVERGNSFSLLSAISNDQWVLTGGDEPLRVTGYRATANTLVAWQRPPVLILAGPSARLLVGPVIAAEFRGLARGPSWRS